MHILPKHGWRLQADKLIKVGTFAMRNVDPRGLSRKPHLHGASDGGGKGAKDEMAIIVLHLQPTHGSLYTVL